MSQMMVYKVLLRTHDDKLVSPVAAPPWEREYVLGERTYPVEDTKLMAFSTLEAAGRFVRDDEVWLAEAEVAYALTRVASWAEDYIAFWREEGIPKYLTYDAPGGTLACDWIEIKERVS